jgi:hypothetical protein
LEDAKFEEKETREYLQLEDDLENQIVAIRKASVQARITEELARLKVQVPAYFLLQL